MIQESQHPRRCTTWLVDSVDGLHEMWALQINQLVSVAFFSNYLKQVYYNSRIYAMKLNHQADCLNNKWKKSYLKKFFITSKIMITLGRNDYNCRWVFSFQFVRLEHLPTCIEIAR